MVTINVVTDLLVRMRYNNSSPTHHGQTADLATPISLGNDVGYKKKTPTRHIHAQLPTPQS